MTDDRNPLLTASGDGLTDLVLRSPAAVVGLLLDNPHLEERHVLLLLRRPELGLEVVSRIAEQPRWISAYLVKAAVVAHPHTPKTIAMNFVKYLFWRDLAKLMQNASIDPAVRRMAETGLRDRIQEISLGERISLARMAPREVVKALREEIDARVVGALLDNPRLTEEDLQLMANNVRTKPTILQLIARAEKWTARRAVRQAIVRNPRTPAQSALPLLAGMAEVDLQAILDWPQLSFVIRKAANRLLAERHARGSSHA